MKVYAYEEKKESRRNRILSLRFEGNTAGKPLLYRISSEYHMENGILFATVCELEGTVFSIMIVQLFGSEEKLDQVQEFIEASGVHAEILSPAEIEEGGND